MSSFVRSQREFYSLRKYYMKLNPKKCALGANRGILGFMIKEIGIEANPKKVNLCWRCKVPKLRENSRMIDV